MTTAPATIVSLVLLLVKSTAVIALASAATWTLRRRTAAARHTVWTTAMIALLALLAGSYSRWHIDVPISMFVPTVSRNDARSAVVPAAVHRNNSARETIAQSKIENQKSPTSGFRPAYDLPPTTFARVVRTLRRAPWSSLLFWTWYLGIAFLAARQLVARVQLSRLSRRAVVIDLQGAFPNQKSKIENQKSLVTVLVSDEVDVPLTWGMFHARILLPSSYTEWDRRRLDNVLRHELAHISRRDVCTALLADVACALFWYNPLVWQAGMRMRVEREIACDEAVLAGGARPSDYASDLLDLAVNVRFGSLHRAGLAIAACPRFERRLRAILDRGPRAGLTRAASVSIFAVALAVLPLAAFQVTTAPAQKIYPLPTQHQFDFQQAVIDGQYNQMVTMATADPSLINSRRREGQTPLYMALMSASKQGPAEAEWLLAHGADVNAQTSIMGDTILMTAIRRDPELVEPLLERGADVQPTNGLGLTALDNGVQIQWQAHSEKGKKEIRDAIRSLIDHGARVSFLAAMLLPDLDLVRKYLADDPSLIHQKFESFGIGRQTPLVIAIVKRRDDPGTYQPVVDAINVYVNEPTPCEAAMLGRTDLLASLPPKAPQKLSDPYNIPSDWSPLGCAVIAGERGTVQYLLNRGFKPDVAMLRQSLHTDVGMVALLLSAGAAQGQEKVVLQNFAKQAAWWGKKDISDYLLAQAR